MRKQHLIITLLCVIFLFSCKENKMKDIMDIHDEVMPKMSSFGKMVGELTSKEDSTAIGLEYKMARQDLQEAHKSMMDWMQGFGSKFDSDEILNGKELSREKKKWLDEEEEKIKAVRNQINESIANAKKLLDKE